MEKKYHINRNREPLTPEDVQKGQDFDSFMKTYAARPKPFFQSATFYVGVAVLGVALAVGGYFVFSGDEKIAANVSTAFVQPPLAGIDIADTTYSLDAATGGEVLYKTGSLIRVPAGAFLDSAGHPVEGKVELHYREFHDPASIFLAGIPMTYDSAGTRFHFESAGMLEITATQDGKPLRANPAQPIKVAMASATADDRFNLYYLDTLKRNWSFVARDKAAIVGFEKDTTVKTKTGNTGLPTEPVMPRKADKSRPGFAIAFEPAEFPELTAYKGVRFEVDETKTPYDRNDKKIQWEDAQIVRNADKAAYTVTFTKGALVRSYVTYIVVDEANYASAKKTFGERYAAYQAAWKQKQEDDKKKQAALETRLMNADAHRIFVNDTLMARALAMSRASFAQQEKEAMVMREFIIRDFGTWNSDCPSSLPEGAELFVKLLDSRTKKPLSVSHVFLVEKGRNAIFTYYSNDLANFRFNPSAENLLWAVTSDGKLAVMDAEAFGKISAGKKSAELTMEVKDEPLTSAEQARSVLGI